MKEGRCVDPLKELKLLGEDRYPLKTQEELWTYGVPKYDVKQEEIKDVVEKEQFNYFIDMYNDSFYPTVMVDRLKSYIKEVVRFIEENDYTKEELQKKFDELTLIINKLQDDFHSHDSEIETVARESIGATIDEILQHFKIDITTEEAIRMRE